MVRERLLPDDDSKTHYAPGSEIDRATSWAHSTQGALWPLSRELPLPRWGRPVTRSILKTPLPGTIADMPLNPKAPRPEVEE